VGGHFRVSVNMKTKQHFSSPLSNAWLASHSAAVVGPTLSHLFSNRVGAAWMRGTTSDRMLARALELRER